MARIHFNPVGWEISDRPDDKAFAVEELMLRAVVAPAYKHTYDVETCMHMFKAGKAKVEISKADVAQLTAAQIAERLLAKIS